MALASCVLRRLRTIPGVFYLWVSAHLTNGRKTVTFGTAHTWSTYVYSPNLGSGYFLFCFVFFFGGGGRRREKGEGKNKYALLPRLWIQGGRVWSQITIAHSTSPPQPNHSPGTQCVMVLSGAGVVTSLQNGGFWARWVPCCTECAQTYRRMTSSRHYRLSA